VHHSENWYHPKALPGLAFQQSAHRYRLVIDGGGGGGGNDGQGKRVFVEELAATFASEMSFL